MSNYSTLRSILALFGLAVETKHECLSYFGQVIKLMQLGVANQIVVIESKSMSEFDRRFQSDSKSNDKSESVIAISI